MTPTRGDCTRSVTKVHPWNNASAVASRGSVTSLHEPAVRIAFHFHTGDLRKRVFPFCHVHVLFCPGVEAGALPSDPFIPLCPLLHRGDTWAMLNSSCCALILPDIGCNTDYHSTSFSRTCAHTPLLSIGATNLKQFAYLDPLSLPPAR